MRFRIEIPFPHRSGYIYKILYFVEWKEGNEASQRHINWIKSYVTLMFPKILEQHVFQLQGSRHWKELQRPNNLETSQCLGC